MSTSIRTLHDFERARRRAFWRRIGTRLINRDNALLALDDVRAQLRVQAQHSLGMRTVAISQIVGSVSRYRDFDRAFLPRQNTTRGRWMSIDRAYYENTQLPPIELYQIGSTYFVKDGNHRVSVAREQGQEFIDAWIVELHCPVPIKSVDDLDTWIRQQDAVAFLAATHLLELRPAAQVELTVPGQYDKLLEHIRVHRWFLGIERHQPVSWDAAVGSWYDRVYSELVEIIKAADVLRDFPGRTEADLYLWIIEHRWFLEQSGELDRAAPSHEVVRAYARAFSPRPHRRLARLAERASRRLAPAVLRKD